MSLRIRIATRGSELALWQAHHVATAIRAAVPMASVELEVIRTTGDRITDVPLSRIGDRGLFTREIDASILGGEADVAVHSLKDVPTSLPVGLAIVAVTERADPSDVVLLRNGRSGSLAALPAAARVGTSSLRRQAQLASLRPDLEIADLRGNLNTRLQKLDRGDYDAIILAAAGVIRLGWSARVAERLDPETWLPAVGQGALAIVARVDDPRTRTAVSTLHHEPTAAAVTAERSCLHALEGGCQIPLGALGTVTGDRLRLLGLVASVDGTRVIRAEAAGGTDEPEAVGLDLAQRLRDSGAAAVLDAIRGSAASAITGP